MSFLVQDLFHLLEMHSMLATHLHVSFYVSLSCCSFQLFRFSSELFISALFNNCVNLLSQYGDIFKIFIGDECKVFIANAEFLEEIMSSNVHITKSNAYKFIKPLKFGLVTSTGKVNISCIFFFTENLNKDQNGNNVEN